MKGRYMSKISPVARSERLEFLDVLRGFAILGMFAVNMTADLSWAWMFEQQPLKLADRTALIVVDSFADGKFITIFSFLFAIGMGIQQHRGCRSTSRSWLIRRS